MSDICALDPKDWGTDPPSQYSQCIITEAEAAILAAEGVQLVRIIRLSGVNPAITAKLTPLSSMNNAVELSTLEKLLALSVPASTLTIG